MNERRTRQLTAGLGGMALALLMLALVVRQAQAATVCQVCLSSAIREADRGPCKGLKYGPSMYDYNYCVQTYMMTKCYGGPEPRPCPGPAGDNGVVRDCNSPGCRLVEEDVRTAQLNPTPDGEPICGNDLTDQGGGTICDNSCYAQSCGTVASSSTCRDKQLPPDGKLRLSSCYVACKCSSQ